MGLLELTRVLDGHTTKVTISSGNIMWAQPKSVTLDVDGPGCLIRVQEDPLVEVEESYTEVRRLWAACENAENR
jgi:hypothetical protein